MSNKNLQDTDFNTSWLASNGICESGRTEVLNCVLSLENNKPVQKHDGGRTVCGFRPSRLIVVVRVALIGFELASWALPQITIAESNIVASASAVTYSIPAGAMADALRQFSQQAGVNISFAAADVRDIATKGLNGKFSIQKGLEHLLAGSGLQGVPQGEGYLVRKQPEGMSEQPAVLPPIRVTASAVTEPTDGYMATKSFSATRTDTPLRDVPQSITVMTQDMMQDQTMQSITDVVRYVPGVVPSQGEGNRDAVIFRGNNTTGDFYVDGLRDDVQYFRDLYNIVRVAF